MKRILFLCLLICSFSSWSQDVVKWDVQFNQQKSQLEITATIADGWHLYSQFINNNVGPVPTSFSFMSSDNYTLNGKVQEPQAIRKYDENFEATLDFFEKRVVFTQHIEVKKASSLEGIITFMVCNETMCLPPVDYKYKINLSSN